jgi:hypothetical protein
VSKANIYHARRKIRRRRRLRVDKENDMQKQDMEM